jgi:putative photosynthetic complex assembly protein
MSTAINTDVLKGNIIPRAAVRAMGVVVALSLLAAVLSSVFGIGTQRSEPAPVVTSIAITFEDRADGSIGVLAYPGLRVIETLAPGTNGFIRGVMRGYARERRLAGHGREQPFILASHRDGQLSLTDPATGRRVELTAFGPVNAEAFGRLLTLGTPESQPKQAKGDKP